MNKVLFFFLSLFPLSLFCQPRIDAQAQYQILKSSPLVTNFVGWAYDEGKGKWAGYYNTIWEVYKGNNQNPIRTSAHNMSFNDNIVSLQMKKLSYKGEIFYALVKVYWTGGFYYPSISEDWYKLQERNIYIFEPEEYEKFFNLTDSLSIIYSYNGLSCYSVSEWTVNNMLKMIFDGNAIERRKYPTEVYIKKEDDNTIRFLLSNSKIKKEERFTKKYYEIKQSILSSLLIK